MADNNIEPYSPSGDLSSEALERLLPKQSFVVLVCDVVESVRWMEHDEDQAIARWSQFAAVVRGRLAPEHEGEVIKSTGDGLMMQFQLVSDAIAAANAMQKLAFDGNQGLRLDRQMHLRIGIHQTEARRDEHDLYGHGVNLAARITTLAGPGEIVVTPNVRDHLTDTLGGHIEDLGECYLKHMSEPQRVYRVGSVIPTVSAESKPFENLLPRIAVMPFQQRLNNESHSPVGDLIADIIIDRVSRCPTIRVLSRLSTSAIANPLALASYGVHADFALVGHFRQQADRVQIWSQVVDLRTNDVVWSGIHQSTLEDLLALDSQAAGLLTAELLDSVFNTTARDSQRSPLPTLTSASLMLGGISLLHRSQTSSHEKSRQVFEVLAERHPRASDVGAWIGKWYVLNTTRGLATDIARDSKMARHHANRALEIDPGNGLAWAMSGFVECHLQRDLSASRAMLQTAVEVNASESLGWLFLSVLDAFENKPIEAVEHADTALSLAPLDPMRYYMESLAASAHLAAGDFQRASVLCESSIRRNRGHASTWRAYITALVNLNRLPEARAAASVLQALVPGYSVSQYRKQSVAGDLEFGQRVAQALSAAGISTD